MHATPRAGIRQTLRRGLLPAVVAVLLSSCAGTSATPGSTAPAVAGVVDGIPVALPDSVTPSVDEVTYTSKTVDVDRATVASSLIGVSSDGTYTFSSAAGALAKLAAGKVMLLEGTDVADVTGVSHSGGHLVVQTSPASLTDLIQNGHIAFSAPMDASHVIGMSASGGVAAASPSASAAATSATQGPAHAMLLDAGCTLDRLGGVLPTFSFRGTVPKFPSWGYILAFSGCSGRITYSLTVCFGVTTSDSEQKCVGNYSQLGAALSMQASGYIDWSDLDADVAVSNGSISSGTYKLDGLTVTYNLNSTAAAGTSVQPTSLPTFRVPLGIEFPVEIGPVPFYCKLQAAIIVHLALSSKNSVMQATSSATATLNGGGTQSGGSSGAAPGTASAGNGTVSPGQSISPAAESLTIAVQLPRIGFGLGVQIANILEYVDVVWSFGFLVGSAFAGEICESWDLKVDAGFQVEGTLGPLRATSARVDFGAKDLAMGQINGCPSI